MDDDLISKEKVEGSSTHVICLLSVRNGSAHNGSSALEDALINKSIFPPGTVEAGDKIQITALKTLPPSESIQPRGSKQRNSTSKRRLSGMQHILTQARVFMVTVFIARTNKSAQEAYYVFTVKEISTELSLQHPSLQVCHISHDRMHSRRLTNISYT